MEILDENGDFIAWFSDDPDDWNSYSDYMRRIRRLVLEYNEVAFEVGAHLLGYNEKDSIYTCNAAGYGSCTGTKQ